MALPGRSTRKVTSRKRRGKSGRGQKGAVRNIMIELSAEDIVPATTQKRGGMTYVFTRYSRAPRKQRSRGPVAERVRDIAEELLLWELEGTRVVVDNIMFERKEFGVKRKGWAVKGKV